MVTTLWHKARQKELCVFVLRGELEVDVKKAAKAAGVKKLEMLPLKDLTKETGYGRGVCSAVGMKRKYPTFIDANAQKLEEIIVSAGRPGVQMKLSPEDLREVSEAIFKDIVKTQ